MTEWEKETKKGAWIIGVIGSVVLITVCACILALADCIDRGACF